MQEPEPMTKTVKASVARQQFSKVLNEVFRGESRVRWSPNFGQVGISPWGLPQRMKMPILRAGVPVRGSIARWCQEPEDRLTPVPGGTTICSPV
jgi:hypothetical protein